MTITLSKNEFQDLRQLIEQESGIVVSEDKDYLIETRLAKMVMENGCNSYHDFYLKAKFSNELLKNKIIDAMTTNETLWFRDEKPYRILESKLLPEWGTKNQDIKIWSAACSTGQEPYSIAMMAREVSRVNQGLKRLIETNHFQITATDLSPSALFLAKNGRYDGIAMSRGFYSEQFKARYFETQGRVSIMKDEIKQLVTFKSFNLKNQFLTVNGPYDCVFLRNVAIYFSQDFKKELFQKIARILKPGGVLMLGSSESLVGLSKDFELHEHQGGMYYRCLGGGGKT